MPCKHTLRHDTLPGAKGYLRRPTWDPPAPGLLAGGWVGQRTLMGALQALIHWTNGHLPLSYRASSRMLWTVSGRSLEKSFSPGLSHGLAHPRSPSQAQPQQVDATGVAGKNKQQAPQSALRESWDPRHPPRLSNPSLAHKSAFISLSQKC